MAFHKTGSNKEYNQLTNEWTTQNQPVYFNIPTSKVVDTEEHKYINQQTLGEIHNEQHHEQKLMHGYNN